MTLKNYLVVMLTLSAICWGIFFFIATLVDPLTTNWLGFLLFYASLFAALSGSIALLGFFVRFIVRKKDLAFNLVRTAFRQSFLLSLFIISLLILKSQNLFNGLNLALLIIIFTIAELFLGSFKKSHNPKN